ncbi:EI24 domain-containing protein [Actinacidiphila yeochonensis]|uniref:EI24 domain-containing protein n=1 Tax=Actinacidiphila yeochonensis TaxID=89050 RepID=UPI000689502A|nr:EI24 domain-containing protein [Actinacidiphila yeochonensis]
MGEVVTGLRLLVEGQRWVARHGRDWRFGMLPALITLAGYAVALVALVVWGDDLVAWATPFAAHWPSLWRGAFRDLLTAVVVGGGLLLAVVSFTAVALLVGGPFYEALAERVEAAEGGAPEAPERPWWRELWIGLRDAVRVLIRVAAFGVVLFALGFVPVLGQTAVPVAGFCVSGYFLVLELAAVAFQRRDVPVKEQLRLLRGHLPMVLGFGVPLVLAFLVPVAAVVLMPGAVAGATLLVRALLPATAAVPAQAGAVPPAPGREARPGSAEPAPWTRDSGSPTDPRRQVM